VKNSRLFLIRSRIRTRSFAKRLCEAISRIYIAQNLQKSVLESVAQHFALGSSRSLQQELEKDENDLHEFKKKNELPSSTLEEVSK